MYSQKVIDQNISRYIDAERRRTGNSKFQLHRFPADVIEEMVEHLDSLIDKKTGEFTRDLTDYEQQFINNELALCSLDWRHYNENYIYIELSSQSDRPEGYDLLEQSAEFNKSKKGGPLGKFILNGMQIALLQKLAELEEIAKDQMARGVPVNGILLILLKARQLGASTMWQSLMRHRVNFFSNFPSLVASIDEDNTKLLHRRSERMYDMMPAWMRNKRVRHSLEFGEEFENGSIINLQNFRQEKDLGKGETWRGFHGTEISSITPDRYEDHFEEGLFHAIPYDYRVLYGMESTAKGKTGPWYDFVTNVMSGTAEGGAGRFDCYFGPFYIIDVMDTAKGQRSKYRMEVPDGWQPARDTQLMAERVKETSHLYMPDHSTVRLPLEVLRWYEVMRNAFYRRGKLNLFKQAYPIEPSDAFQHGAAGAFTTETIERLELNCAKYEPIPYRIIAAEEKEDVEAYIPDFYDPARAIIHQVGGYYLGPMHPAELDKDPRGIFWFYEQPDTRATYKQSADPSGGIPKWSRAFRQHNDINTDNASIDIFKKPKSVRPCEKCSSRGWLPTDQPNVQLECTECDGRGKIGGRGVQVVHFQAPLDPEEFALPIWLLGKLFRGDDELDECEAIIERNNTGILTIRTLQNRYHYSNLWQTQTVMEGEVVKIKGDIGWHSHPSTVPVLHARGRIATVRRDIEIRCKYTVKELSDAIVKTVGAENEKTKAITTYERFVVPPGGGRHDDAMTTLFLAVWLLWDWTDIDSDVPETAGEKSMKEIPSVNLRPDASAEMQQQAWNLAAEALFGQFDLDFGHHPDCDVTCTANHASEDQLEEEELLGGYYDEEDHEFSE